MADQEATNTDGDISDEMKEQVLIGLFKNVMKADSRSTKSQPEVVNANSEETLEAESKSEPSTETISGVSAAEAETEQELNESPEPPVSADSEVVPKEHAKEEPKKTDPIKELETRLAFEEASLTDAQLKERLEESHQLKSQANNLYKEADYLEAVSKYSKSLEICPLREGKDRAVLHANRAAALIANQQNKEALPDLDRALELDPNYLKALERRARLHKTLDNLDDSLKDYEKLLELKPKHYAYMATIDELREQIKVRNEELKAKMIDSLKQLGNVFLKPFGLSTENFSMVPSEGGGYSLQMKGQQ